MNETELKDDLINILLVRTAPLSERMLREPENRKSLKVLRDHYLEKICEQYIGNKVGKDTTQV